METVYPQSRIGAQRDKVRIGEGRIKWIVSRALNENMHGEKTWMQTAIGKMEAYDRPEARGLSSNLVNTYKPLMMGISSMMDALTCEKKAECYSNPDMESFYHALICASLRIQGADEEVVSRIDEGRRRGSGLRVSEEILRETCTAAKLIRRAQKDGKA